MTRGIDYGRYPMANGQLPNRDPETGIRYGVLPLSALNEFAWESFEAQYAHCCPTCGDDWPEDHDEDTCIACGEESRDDERWSDEPIANVCDDDEYQASVDSSSDVWIYKSPYFTRATFCSPCAPGACYLTSPCEDGERAYCLGHEWFDERAPYPVYLVATGELIEPPTK